MLQKIDLKNALAQREACALIPDFGYVRLGVPPMPRTAIYPPSACLPPTGTADGSIHDLIVHGETVRMIWRADAKAWSPLSVLQGNRLAFGAAYLAAYGWKLA